MTGKQAVKIMQDNGWTLDRIEGSHHVMTKDGMRSVPVPIHGNKDLGDFAKKILRQAGITV
jgi:predicted RNA binding protein YcfA (HicA-like mRNA interferase family)